MENEISTLDKTLKISIIFILVSIALSFSYYFFAKPFLTDRSLKKCLQESQNRYEKENDDMGIILNSIYEDRSVKESEKQKLEERQRLLSDSIENEIRSLEMAREFGDRKDRKFIENECNNISKSEQRLSFSFKCDNKLLENSVIRDYKNENQDYAQVSGNLDQIRSDIEQLNKKIDDIKLNERVEKMDETLKKDEDFCFKLY